MKYVLKVDFNKCEECGNCEKLLPGFRNAHGGIVKDISQWVINEEEIVAAINSVRDGCKSGAIIFCVE